MKFQKIILVASFLLLANSPAFAASDNEALKFNLNFLNIDRDSAMFLNSLVLLNENDGKEVKKFMEYKLDEIVCATWELQEKMNPGQKKRAMAFLQEIKAYRSKNPRVAGTTIDPQKFYEYYEPFNSSYALRADKILASLQ